MNNEELLQMIEKYSFVGEKKNPVSHRKKKSEINNSLDDSSISIIPEERKKSPIKNNNKIIIIPEKKNTSGSKYISDYMRDEDLNKNFPLYSLNNSMKITFNNNEYLSLAETKKLRDKITNQFLATNFESLKNYYFGHKDSFIPFTIDRHLVEKNINIIDEENGDANIDPINNQHHVDFQLKQSGDNKCSYYSLSNILGVDINSNKQVYDFLLKIQSNIDDNNTSIKELFNNAPCDVLMYLMLYLIPDDWITPISGVFDSNKYSNYTKDISKKLEENTRIYPEYNETIKPLSWFIEKESFQNYVFQLFSKIILSKSFIYLENERTNNFGHYIAFKKNYFFNEKSNIFIPYWTKLDSLSNGQEVFSLPGLFDYFFDPYQKDIFQIKHNKNIVFFFKKEIKFEFDNFKQDVSQYKEANHFNINNDNDNETNSYNLLWKEININLNFIMTILTSNLFIFQHQKEVESTPQFQEIYDIIENKIKISLYKTYNIDKNGHDIGSNLLNNIKDIINFSLDSKQSDKNRDKIRERYKGNINPEKNRESLVLLNEINNYEMNKIIKQYLGELQLKIREKIRTCINKIE
jgi:hypothetical protein